ncbi:hypothetical protein BN1723_010594 [Verticillium longisporum]|uniref:Peroxin 22-like protein n=1 Tax=Verticillium longisporum TaxID=100787 RepID=A0A0G4L0N1_VERLO|nr:hypothetical protein BN1723_010594 [Verticillium longisporum]
MSPPYDNSSRRRGVWSHWAPLAVTVTVATVGVATWVWSQRKDDNQVSEQDDHVGLDYDNADYGDNPAYGSSTRGPKPSTGDSRDQTQGTTHLHPDATDETWGARVSGALRRTPSPQQFFEHAGKTVTAGVAAAGAAAGRALAAIREEDKGAYADHETWSEEANARKDRPSDSQPRALAKRRKTVVIVVSADTSLNDTDEDGFLEHASILSHIPRYTDFSKFKVFVLIYAPGLKDTPVDSNSNLPPPSLSSSFSNIEHQQAQTPVGESSKSPVLDASASPAFGAIHSQALSLVEKDSMVLPFSSPNGYAHILRHLQPEVVYLQESLAGDNGSIVTNMQAWLRHEIVLVVGAESGDGGLADSESEAEKADEKWWQRPERVGRGRGVVVVDGTRVGDDWARRVQGKE